MDSGEEKEAVEWLEEDNMTHRRNDGNTNVKDEARTPIEIFRKLQKEFNIHFDVACTQDNALCMPLTLDNDALDIPWYSEYSKGLAYFCNPPYSNGNILKFVHKAWMESGNGATVVLLIPSDASTEYFEFCFHNAHEIRFLIPRVRFNNPDGTPFKGSPQTGSMIVVFKPGEPEGGFARCSIWRWKD